MSQGSIEHLFVGMANASMAGAGQRFTPGFRGLVKTKALRTSNGFKGPFFHAELEILESNSPETDPVGASRSYSISMKPTNTYAQGDIKLFMLALLGYSQTAAGAPGSPAHAEAEEATRCALFADYARTKSVSPDDFIGLTCHLETWPKPMAKGGVWTVMQWRPTEDPWEGANRG